MAYTGAIFDQKGCLMVIWVEGKFHGKNQGPDLRADEVMYMAIFETYR